MMDRILKWGEEVGINVFFFGAWLFVLITILAD